MTRILLTALLLAAPVAAQASRTWIDVTPQGVFVRSDIAHGGSAPELVNPHPSSAGLRWTYAAPIATPWITERVSVGNLGTFAWLGQNVNGERVSLLSTTEDAVPPATLYEHLLTGADLVMVAAADKGWACAVTQCLVSSNLFEFRYSEGSAATPTYTLAVPVGAGTGCPEPAISADGSRAAVGYTDTAGLATVDVWDASGALVNSLTVPTGGFREHDMSADGSTVLIATGDHDYLYDVNSGALLFDDGSTVSTDAHAISGDGQAWGRGGFDVGAWVFNGSSWVQVLDFADGAFGFFVPLACGISADGSTFAAAAYDATNPNRFRVYAWSLSPSGSTLLWTYIKTGTGALQDAPSAVSLSDDGRWIAVGSWGNASQSHPEALLFDRDAGNVPVASVDTPGSVFDLDLSGDGQFLVIGTKAVHANDFGSGGEGYSFDRGGQGQWLTGTPSIGQSVTLHFGGNPGDAVFLFAALGLLAEPLHDPGTMSGDFFLDPDTVILGPIFTGTVPGSGTLALSTTIPNIPAAVGISLYTQTIRTPEKAIDNFLTLALTP
jgi:hypothetical protein